MLNTIQKVGLFITTTIVLVFLVLHNPFDGYDTTNVDSRCFIYEYKELVTEAYTIAGGVDGALNPRQMKRYNAYIETNKWKVDRDCDITPIPFLDWESNNSIFTQITSIKDFLLFSIPTIILGCIWIFLFRDNKPEESE